jgi:hypothetical protein
MNQNNKYIYMAWKGYGIVGYKYIQVCVHIIKQQRQKKNTYVHKTENRNEDNGTIK